MCGIFNSTCLFLYKFSSCFSIKKLSIISRLSYNLMLSGKFIRPICIDTRCALNSSLYLITSFIQLSSFSLKIRGQYTRKSDSWSSKDSSFYSELVFFRHFYCFPPGISTLCSSSNSLSLSIKR